MKMLRSTKIIAGLLMVCVVGVVSAKEKSKKGEEMVILTCSFGSAPSWRSLFPEITNWSGNPDAPVLPDFKDTFKVCKNCDTRFDWKTSDTEYIAETVNGQIINISRYDGTATYKWFSKDYEYGARSWTMTGQCNKVDKPIM